MPLISVLMPVWNSSKYLDKSIPSILNQSFQNFEFIIIDDGSSDDSLSIIKKYARIDKRIRFYTQENKGISYTLNKGIRISKSQVIARMDADDISINSRLELQYNFLINNLEYKIIGSNAFIIDDSGKHVGLFSKYQHDYVIKKKLPSNPFIHSTVMYYKKFIIDNGGYNEDIYQFFEDKLLWLKVSSKSKFYNIQTPLIHYRISKNSVSSYTKKEQKKIDGIIKFYLHNSFIKKTDIKFLKQLKVSQKNKFKKIGNYYYRLGVLYQVEKKYLLGSCYLFMSWLYSILLIRRLVLSIKYLLMFLFQKTFDLIQRLFNKNVRY